MKNLLYPVALKAPVRDYVWGGERLKIEFGIDSNAYPAAEAWVLSTRNDFPSIILNGEFKGKTLGDYISKAPEEILGSNCKRFTEFPLLIKLIDAKDNLSLQVHPDDEYAMANENSFGKTEMWYVIDCDEGAQLIYGWNRRVKAAEFDAMAENNTLIDACNIVKVKKGDLFFIPSGTLHAIGKGILIAEVQQNSDLTYRVYDYDRLGADGNRRELHIEKALQVMNFNAAGNPYSNFPLCCDYFKTDFIKTKVNDCNIRKNENSFEFLLVIDGSGELSCKNILLKLKKGTGIFVPAGLEYCLSGELEILVTAIPEEKRNGVQ